jgi:hypothetical protein
MREIDKFHFHGINIKWETTRPVKDEAQTPRKKGQKKPIMRLGANA